LAKPLPSSFRADFLLGLSRNLARSHGSRAPVRGLSKGRLAWIEVHAKGFGLERDLITRS